MILPYTEILLSLSKEKQEELQHCANIKQFTHVLNQNEISAYPAERLWREQQIHSLAAQCPFPIGSQLSILIHDAKMIDEGESKPQFYLSLCSISSLILRYLASISIQLYIELTKASALDFNTKMVKIIEKATDNQWQNITKDILQYIKDACKNKEQKQHWMTNKPEAMTLYKEMSSAFDSSVWNTIHKEEVDANHLFNLSRKGNRVDLKKTSDLLTHLVYFRNKIIHAEKIPQERYQGTVIALISIMVSLKKVWEYKLGVQVGDHLWDLSRIVPKKQQKKLFEGEKQVYLYKGDTILLNLSPLLCVPQTIKQEDDLEDVFFINVGVLKDLNYLSFQSAEHRAGKTLGTYEQFKKYMASIPTPPIPKEDRYDFEDYATDKAKHFVGRKDVIDEISEQIKNPEVSYIELRALAGMGKTAIMANLYQKREPDPEEESILHNYCWAFHFCMNTDGRNTAIRAYRSIISTITTNLQINNPKKYLSWELKELKERFTMLLNGKDVEKQLAKKNFSRLIIAIDALDEGFGGEEGVVEFIPPHLNESVVFLVSYRVNTEIKNQRVQNVLQQLPEQKTHILNAANPLKGLMESDVREFLRKIQGEETQEKTFAQVWTAASQDLEGQYADPFYLRFVLDGVQQNRVFLSRPETIPSSLDDAFEEKWLSLPRDFHFLGHRLLLTLAIMRDHGDDELFLELFNRNKRNPEEDEDLSLHDIVQTRISIGKLLIYDGDRYSLFHDRFRYFLVGEQKDPIEEALGL